MVSGAGLALRGEATQAIALLGVDLAAEVDGKSHQDDHHQAGRGEPDAHRPPFPIGVRTGCGDGHHRSR